MSEMIFYQFLSDTSNMPLFHHFMFEHGSGLKGDKWYYE